MSIGIIEKSEFNELSIEERRARNLEAIAELGQSHADILKKYTPHSELVTLDNGQYDVLFRGKYLYEGKGGETYVAEHMDKLWVPESAVSSGFITGKDLDKHCVIFAEKFEQAIKDAGLTISNSKLNTDHSYFIISLGIGLAGHLEYLAERSQCRVLSLFDVNYEFLYHSLSVFDWASFIASFREQGRLVVLTINDEPAAIVGRVQGTIRSFNPASLDGTRFYIHYSHASFQRAVDELTHGALKVGMMGLGYMWDEMRMVAHTYKNLEAGTANVLKKLSGLIDAPVFIVANGPSLDETIDWLKEHQNDGIVFACGSTLDALLINGIKPDVLLMLEQDKGLLRDQAESAKLGDLSDIVFCGASNMYPGVMDHHKKRIIFFRPGLSPCPIFAQNPEQYPFGVDPLVANAAMVLALYAGFKNIYMFGVDVGAASGEYHHSKHSQYTTRGVVFKQKFTEKGRGNFGGQFVATPVMMWSKKSLETLIKGYAGGCIVYNCSNGQRIGGAIPLHYSMLDIPKLKNKRAIVEDFVDRFPVYEVDDFKEAWAKADILHTIPQIFKALVRCLDEDWLTFRHIQRAMEYLHPGDNKPGEALVVRGTIYHMLMVLYTAQRRLEQTDEMDKFIEVSKKAFEDAIQEFDEELNEWLTSLVDGTMEWITDPDDLPPL